MANKPKDSTTHNLIKSYEYTREEIHLSGVPLWVYYAYYSNQFLNGDMAQQFNESYIQSYEDDLYDDEEPHGI
jgi:hypothetical protein